jgi:Mrp family chromosome partitioning ATPase
LKTEPKSASDLDVVFSKAPADLLSSQAMQDLVADLRLKYDYIVVDASPLLAVANPLTLAPIADKIVVIIEWGHRSRTNFSEALKTLSLIGYSIRGIVLNKVDYKRLASYAFGLVQTILMAHALRAIGKY